jgi:hypothetical protein
MANPKRAVTYQSGITGLFLATVVRLGSGHREFGILGIVANSRHNHREILPEKWFDKFSFEKR